jgi:hypothetical protein
VNDELPKLFEQCLPRPAPADLRARTLTAVDRELNRRRKRPWERVFELTAAAILLVGIGLNAWLLASDHPWRAGRPDGHFAATPAVRSQAGGSFAAHGLRPWGDAQDNERYRRLIDELSHGRIPESL